MSKYEYLEQVKGIRIGEKQACGNEWLETSLLKKAGVTSPGWKKEDIVKQILLCKKTNAGGVRKVDFGFTEVNGVRVRKKGLKKTLIKQKNGIIDSNESKELISRYIPFDQYMDFLSKGLFIPKATKLNDPWECLVQDKWISAGFLKLLHGNPKGKVFNPHHQYLPWAKEWIYVSCWHKNSSESMAMWKLYGRYENSVVIESTISNLIKAIDRYSKKFNSRVELQDVTYLLPGKTPVEGFKTLSPIYIKGPTLQPNLSGKTGLDTFLKNNAINTTLHALFKKHLSNRYENELRMVIADPNPKPFNETNPKEGIYIPFKKLINKVRVSPKAPDWFLKVVEDVTKKYKPEIRVCKSEIDDF